MANNDGNNAPEDELEQAIQQLAEITRVDEAFAHFMLQENDYDLNVSQLFGYLKFLTTNKENFMQMKYKQLV